MDLWDAPITIAELAVAGALMLPELFGLVPQPAADAERRAPASVAAPRAVSGQLVAGRVPQHVRYFITSNDEAGVDLTALFTR